MDGSSGSSAGGDDAIVAGGAGTGGGGPGSSSLASSLLSGAGGTSAAGGSSGGAGGGSGDGSRRSEEAVACVHYERRCSVVAPCCGVAYGCRVCHDEMSLSCGPMDRFAVEEVVCKECRERQPSKTNECRACGVTFAEYHCPKCNIWMALSKRPFHCDECGFCRVGGRENFKHCATCCMCVAASVHATHSCMREKYKNNCPVCREDMFSSRQSPQDLPCGHVIHSHCFRNLAGFDYRCPICKKTVLSRATERHRDAAHAGRPGAGGQHPMQRLRAEDGKSRLAFSGSAVSGMLQLQHGGGECCIGQGFIGSRRRRMTKELQLSIEKLPAKKI
ncbi:hypothetical protein ACHAWF_003303 [Thalassiosira exigua]